MTDSPFLRNATYQFKGEIDIGVAKSDEMVMAYLVGSDGTIYASGTRQGPGHIELSAVAKGPIAWPVRIKCSIGKDEPVFVKMFDESKDTP